MAHLSGDEGLTTAFQQGLDIHRATAAEVFGVGLDAVTQDQRRSAKAINFGLIYGMSAFGLSKQLGIPRVDAQTYMDLYFQRYPGVSVICKIFEPKPQTKGMLKPGLVVACTCLKLNRLISKCVKPRNAPRSMRQCRGRRPISSNAP
jgi:DNA polymerase-1